MDVRPIYTDADLAWARAEVAPYFENPPAKGSAEAARFDVLSTLIEAYERSAKEAIGAEDPIDFLKSFMEVTGRSQTDLAAVLGSPSRASEILRRKRALSVGMMQRLHAAWGVPADALRPYAGQWLRRAPGDR